MASSEKWDAVEYRKTVTPGRVIAALMAHLPTRPDVPEMPTRIDIEEAIKMVSRVERLEAGLETIIHTAGHSTAGSAEKMWNMVETAENALKEDDDGE